VKRGRMARSEVVAGSGFVGEVKDGERVKKSESV
jgi:hypothetical protein